MRALRNLGIFIVALLVVAVVADLGASYLVENRIESTIEGADTAVDVGNVDAHVDSFPFLGRLATQGQVDQFSLRLEDLAYDGGRFDALELDVDGVLTLSTDGLGVLTIPIAEGQYFPCAVDARVEQGRFVLSCTATELPPALRQVVGGGGIS